MPLVERFLKQVLVYWAPKAAVGSGQPLFADPIELKCRWTEVHEEIVRQNGDAVVNVVCTSCVLTLVDLAEQGVCWLAPGVRTNQPAGTALGLLTSSSDPFKNPRAFQVQRTGEVQSVDGTDSVKKAYL